ncbi:hypothetical protein AVEN_263307-1 [Araneus ventricosus]|uniref:Uncharacterized protein n=1 Tax=Araneus ventricosus TaxID=182803 RepID=A0A4Y2KGG0_ARAVE|nr:hypothetical protein AVEN_263307-1 [Araneus ventricosus]
MVRISGVSGGSECVNEHAFQYLLYLNYRAYAVQISMGTDYRGFRNRFYWSLVLLTFHFYVTRGLNWDESRNLEPLLDNEDDTWNRHPFSKFPCHINGRTAYLMCTSPDPLWNLVSSLECSNSESKTFLPRPLLPDSIDHPLCM